MLSINWLPLSWLKADKDGIVFRVTELGKYHGNAVAAWQRWDTSRTDVDKQVMNEDLRDYLELASSTKYDILTTGWAGLGLGVVSTSTRLTGYWLLVGIILALGIATANYEDFPASVTKPTSVCILDIVAHVTEFLLEVGHASTPNCCTRMFQFLSLVGGFGWRIGRGFLISRDVPNTPITSRCDWFNTFGLAMLHGVKWAFGLMAWPATAIALTGPDEPFVLVKDTGKWLTREERRALLAVVLSNVDFRPNSGNAPATARCHG